MSKESKHWRLRGVRLRMEVKVDDEGNPTISSRPKAIKKLIKTEPDIKAIHHAQGEALLMNPKQTKKFIKQLEALQNI